MKVYRLIGSLFIVLSVPTETIDKYQNGHDAGRPRCYIAIYFWLKGHRCDIEYYMIIVAILESFVRRWKTDGIDICIE